MSDANELNSELAPLASALRELAPAAGGLSRDRLLFEAGRAAAAIPHAWIWPVAAGGFAVLAVVFAGLMAASEPRTLVVYQDRPVEVRVEVPVPVEAVADPHRDPSPSVPEIAAVAQTSPSTPVAEARRMVELRRDILRWGVEMLPTPKPGASSASPPGDPEMREWLRPLPGVYASPYTFPFRPPSIRSGGND